MFMCMFVCMYVCMCVCMCVCMLCVCMLLVCMHSYYMCNREREWPSLGIGGHVRVEEEGEEEEAKLALQIYMGQGFAALSPPLSYQRKEGTST